MPSARPQLVGLLPLGAASGGEVASSGPEAFAYGRKDGRSPRGGAGLRPFGAASGGEVASSGPEAFAYGRKDERSPKGGQDLMRLAAAASATSFGSYLAAAAEQYHVLEEENRRLQDMLASVHTGSATAAREAKPQEGESSPTQNGEKRRRGFGGAPDVAAVAQQVAGVPTLMRGNTSYQQVWGDIAKSRLRGVCTDRFNAQRQQLQTLLAELDPEMEDLWFEEEVSFKDFVHLMDVGGSSSAELREDRIKELLRVVAQELCRIAPGEEPKVTKGAIVDITSMTELEAILTPEQLQCCLMLRDAVITQTINRLLISGHGSGEFPHGMFSEGEVVGFSASIASIRGTFTNQRLCSRQDAIFYVDLVGMILILLNTVIIGVSTDHSPDWPGWNYVNGGFSVSFTLEMVARLWLIGLRVFFCSKGSAWNWVDFMLVLFSLVDLIYLAASTARVGMSLTVMRLVRLARLSRIARLAKMPIFQEIGHMMRSIRSGWRTLAWSFIVILLISYVGGVLLVQIVGRDYTVDEGFVNYREAHFSTVDRAMFTMFVCITGACETYDGQQLSILMRDRYGVGVIISYALLFMIVNFGLFNVIMSIFVQNTQRASRFSDDERRKLRRQNRRYVARKTLSLVHRVYDLYLWRRKGRRVSIKQPSEADMTSITISRTSFEDMLKDAELNQILDDLGLEDVDRLTLFDLVDGDGNGKLALPELVDGISRLIKGGSNGFEGVLAMLRCVQARLINLEGALMYRQLEIESIVQNKFLPIGALDKHGSQPIAAAPDSIDLLKL